MEWIHQELKELDVYLDDLCRQTEKDAGHLWIAFSDKFKAFKKRLTESPSPTLTGRVEDRARKYADYHIGVLSCLSNNKREDDWETLRASYVDGAKSQQQSITSGSVLSMATSLRWALNKLSEAPNSRLACLSKTFDESGVTIAQHLEQLWEWLTSSQQSIPVSVDSHYIQLSIIDACNEYRDASGRETIPAKAYLLIAKEATKKILSFGRLPIPVSIVEQLERLIRI